MIKISVKSDIQTAISALNEIQKKSVPYATARALTEVAKITKDAEQKAIISTFDRPTKFTVNAVFYAGAQRRDNPITAKVWLKDHATKSRGAGKYLQPQIFGGQRGLKGFEELLKARGVLPAGYYVVPSKKVKKDAYGNINKGVLNQILSYSGAQRDRAQNTRQGAKRQQKQRFILLDARDGMPGGIWQITADSRLFPMLIFVKAPRYNNRFDFFGVAEKTVNKHLRPVFDKWLDQALKTAKPR